MKQFFLLLIAGLIIITPCAAQLLPKYWFYPLSGPNIPGRQMNFMDTAQFPRMKAQRVKTRTQYTYNELSGRKTKIATYRFDASGNLTRFEMYFDTDSLQVMEYIWFKYDFLGRLILSHDSLVLQMEEISYYYDAKGRRSKEECRNLHGVLLHTTEYYYDSRDRVIESKRKSGPKLLSGYRLKYADNGYVSSYESYVAKGIVTQRSIYEYDAGSRLVSDSKYYLKDSLKLIEKWTSEYNSEGKLVVRKDYAGDGSLHHTMTYTYNDAGDVTSMHDEAVLYTSTNYIFYDSTGLVYKESYDANGNYYTLLSYDYYPGGFQSPAAFVLNHVLFVSGEGELLPASFPELDSLRDHLTMHPELKIEIAGHTDNVGDEQSNIKLSTQRAEAVANYLIMKGIDSTRIAFRGYGSTMPVATNNTPEGRQQNRRVEFVLIAPSGH
jgi:outer membrane protein OmpA-like peptidoglycan-associated protein